MLRIALKFELKIILGFLQGPSAKNVCVYFLAANWVMYIYIELKIRKRLYVASPLYL